MKKYLATALFLLFLPLTAHASEGGALCQLLQATNDDVAYVPNVDVNGKDVVPADVVASPKKIIPDVIRIPLTVDLAAKFQSAFPEDTKLDTDLMMIAVYRDGRVVLNEEDVAKESVEICGLDIDVDAFQSRIKLNEKAIEMSAEEVATPMPILVPAKDEDKDRIIWGD